MSLNPNLPLLLLWLHVTAGIIWIGLLYYFSFIQIPAMAEAQREDNEQAMGLVYRYMMRRVVAWFRWAALITWLAGIAYLHLHDRLLGVFSLGLAGSGPPLYLVTLGVGSWLATLMLINAWLFVWPAQKKLQGLDGASKEEVEQARYRVYFASRCDVVMSVPMLLFMLGGAHPGLIF